MNKARCHDINHKLWKVWSQWRTWWRLFKKRFVRT